MEIRGATTLKKSSYVSILEKMYEGRADVPEPPPPLTEDVKKGRERAALVRGTISEITRGRHGMGMIVQSPKETWQPGMAKMGRVSTSLNFSSRLYSTP